MKAPKTIMPAAPDPVATAQAQTASNVDTAVANSYIQNANETGPYGSVNYSINGYQTGPNGLPIPQFTRTVSLSPAEQQKLDLQNQAEIGMNNLANSQISRLTGILGSPIDLSGLPQRGQLPGAPSYSAMAAPGRLQTSVGQDRFATSFGNVGDQTRSFANVAGPQMTVGPADFSADRQKVEDALYARVNPQLERDRAARSSELAAQGIAPGSEAYREAMGLLDRQSNDARMQVITAGGQEQSRLADLAFTQFGLQNNAQAQAFAQAQARGQFSNDAQAQAYAQALGRAQFGNEGTAANNAARMAQAEFFNTATQGNTDNAFRSTAYGNDLAGRGFSDSMSLAQAQDTARERALQESLLPRNQAINEISALLNGGQVNMPQFTEYRPGTVANTPIGDYIYNSAAITNSGIQQRNQAKQSAYSANLSGLYGLGSAALGAGGYYFGSKK